MKNLGPAAGTEAAKNPSQPVTLEPIENYKGKSVEELEAILDAYNAQKATNVVKHDPADEGAGQEPGLPAPPKRGRSQALASKAEESKEAAEPLQKRRQQSGVR